ncbi:small ribosomal subunit protein bS21m-like isoform X2 [Convolutriloba macropyga]|uniref:small ribosomal subunit protein bS21m-like isoform X2 n=1 Tax=Convolutriloba macropyga TaxID=536237 RepID=UPI003F5265B7
MPPRLSREFNFAARTVMLRNPADVINAYRKLQMRCQKEGILKEAQRQRYFERPAQRRKRLAIEKCTTLYNQGLHEKLDFIKRAYRPDPWLH